MSLRRRRAGLTDVGEDLIDDCWIGDVSNDPQRSTTQGVGHRDKNQLL